MNLIKKELHFREAHKIKAASQSRMREQEGPMVPTEGTHAGGEFLLVPMGVGLREHVNLRGCCIVTVLYQFF